MAGAFPPALRLLESLDVKNIQMESVTHVVVDGSLQLRTETETTQLFSNILAFHTRALGETPRLVCLPYQEGSYSKLGEFYQFLEMLHNSHQAAALKVERSFFLVSMTSKATLESFKEVLQAYRDTVPLADEALAKLHDTRDNSACDGYHELAELTTGFRLSAADLDVASPRGMLRLRASMFHFLAAALLEPSGERLAQLLAVVEEELKALGIPRESLESTSARLEAACWQGIVRVLRLAKDVQVDVEAIREGAEAKLVNCYEQLPGTQAALEQTWAEVAAAVEREGTLRAELLPAAVCFVTQILAWNAVLALRWVEASPKKAPKSATPAIRAAVRAPYHAGCERTYD